MGVAAAGSTDTVPARNSGNRQSAGTRARVGSRTLVHAGCGAIFVRDEASRVMVGENCQCVA